MKKLILFTVLAFGVMTQSMAQKLGHANFEEVVGLLPERAAAEKQVQDLQQKLEARLNSMVETYQQKTNEFTTDTSLSDAMRNSLRSEIADMERRIQEFQQTAYTEIEVKQNELMGAMIEKVKNAAVEVGKAGEYTYIFDSSSAGGLLYAGGEDVTGKIKTQLGI
jgi:outer membrane protein